MPSKIFNHTRKAQKLQLYRKMDNQAIEMLEETPVNPVLNISEVEKIAKPVNLQNLILSRWRTN